MTAVMHLISAKHPQQWTKDDVAVWLRWCGEEYSIEAVPADKFDMNGRCLSVCIQIKKRSCSRISPVSTLRICEIMIFF